MFSLLDRIFLVWSISLIDYYFVYLCKNTSLVNTKRDILKQDQFNKENHSAPF